MKAAWRRALAFALTAYTALLVYWMFFGFGRHTYANYMYNLKPFSTIMLYLSVSGRGINTYKWLLNLAGNIGVFVPFGFMLPAVFNKTFLNLLYIIFSGIFVLELLQLITKRGSFDVDDFLLNIIGFSIGYLIYLGARRASRSKAKRHRTAR
ncbi:MAG TPA: VanZ family protein [Candidatus Atribacteria bacterium]|nr:VanZ family protein [Candidatus Atribacteria bacterium]